MRVPMKVPVVGMMVIIAVRIIAITGSLGHS
jgi:hypothetical protein